MPLKYTQSDLELQPLGEIVVEIDSDGDLLFCTYSINSLGKRQCNSLLFVERGLDAKLAGCWARLPQMIPTMQQLPPTGESIFIRFEGINNECPPAYRCAAMINDPVNPGVCHNVISDRFVCKVTHWLPLSAFDEEK